jgi:hypothetical protein
MNVLILAPQADHVDLSLQVGGAAPPVPVLVGRVSLGTPAVAELRDTQGSALHRHEYTGERLAAGVVAALTWLRSRNIRVDVAVHEVGPLLPNDLIIRLSPAMKGALSGAPAKQARESLEAVTAWDDGCPQFLHYATDPGNLNNLFSALARTARSTPANCRQNRKVRCDACAA